MSQLFQLPGSVKRDPSIDAWLRRHTGALGEIARHWFEVLRQCGEDVREVLHDGHPTACVGDAAFAYVNAFKAHVNVGFFRGAELADPAGLLEGDGKFMRHVKLRPGSACDAAALSQLVRAAYSDMNGRVDENMNADIKAFNEEQESGDREICDALSAEIDRRLPEAQSRIWHRHPVWFLDGNPTVGYSKLKAGVRLMFWSGADFKEDRLKPGTGKFKDASIIYTSVEEVRTTELARWLKKSREIQWDYKNIYKTKGELMRLK